MNGYDFLSGDDGGKLDGKALHETSSLRMLLRTTLRPSCDPLNSKTLEWRDIGLRVPSRVETVAKKYNLKTVAELEDLAIFGCVIQSTSKDLTRPSQKDNLGDKSLGSLCEEFVDSLPRDVKSNDFELGRQLCLDEKWYFYLLLNLSGYSSEPLTRDARR